MKRPMATIGFSMLLTFLLITNITHRMTVVLLMGTIVIFCCFIIIKRFRKQLFVIFALFGAIAFTLSFISAEEYYFNEKAEMEKEQIMTGVVCGTPTDSDYAFSYIIKPDDKNYKVRFVSQDDKFLNEGDCVELAGACENKNTDSDMFGNSLSSKVYFTFFESDECNIDRTGEINYYYKNIGAVKRVFSEIVTKYLPGKNGTMALAITIGDKSGLDEKVVDNFNYCGTSHLLVISGLHLTLWSSFIVSFLNRFSKIRKYSPYIGLACLFLYASVTGFSVSVIRAGAMVGMVYIGRLFNRDADSINSIGLAVAFILLFNPFAPFSAALWLSVLSTLGILAYSGKIDFWINEKFSGKFVSKMPLFHLFVETFSISFSTMVFTLPVFIFKFRMISVASVLTNFIMVDMAMIMMVCTFLGVLSHLVFLKPIAQLCFMVTGIIGKILHVVSEKIGMAEWSTISLSHKYYEYFFLLLASCVLIVVAAKKYKIRIEKHITVFLSVLFIILAIYCTAYDYNTPVAEIVGTADNPVITVNYKGKTTLIGTQEKKYISDIKEMLNKHNKKRPDTLVVTEVESKTVAEIINIYDNFGKVNTCFYGSSPKIFDEIAQSNTRKISISDNLTVDLEQKDYIEVSANGKHLVITEYENTENIYENIKDCDIIIIYGGKSSDYEEFFVMSQNDTQVIALDENKRVTVCF